MPPPLAMVIPIAAQGGHRLRDCHRWPSSFAGLLFGAARAFSAPWERTGPTDGFGSSSLSLP